MIIDHVGYYLLQDNMWCRLIGRGAAPLFFFLIGYAGKCHITPLLCIFGIILTLSTSLVLGYFQVNILPSFILIHYAFTLFPAQRLNTLVRMIAFFSCCALTVLLYSYIEYGLLGFLIAYGARLVALEDKEAPFWLMMSLMVYFIWESFYFQFLTTPLMLYSFAFMNLCLFLVMSQYRLRTLPCPPLLLTPSLVLSRYSLEVYFIHLFLLQCYSLLHLG